MAKSKGRKMKARRKRKQGEAERRANAKKTTISQLEILKSSRGPQAPITGCGVHNGERTRSEKRRNAIREQEDE